jgi:hypothetical protein
MTGNSRPQEDNNRASRLIRQTVLKGFESINRIYLVCIRIPGENLKNRLGRIMISVIAANR